MKTKAIKLEKRFTDSLEFLLDLFKDDEKVVKIKSRNNGGFPFPLSLSFASFKYTSSKSSVIARKAL